MPKVTITPFSMHGTVIPVNKIDFNFNLTMEYVEEFADSRLWEELASHSSDSSCEDLEDLFKSLANHVNTFLEKLQIEINSNPLIPLSPCFRTIRISITSIFESILAREQTLSNKLSSIYLFVESVCNLLHFSHKLSLITYEGNSMS